MLVFLGLLVVVDVQVAREGPVYELVKKDLGGEGGYIKQPSCMSDVHPALAYLHRLPETRQIC